MNNREAIIEKAKNTEYKHPSWYCESGESVYDVIYRFVKTFDFYIDLVSTLTSVDMLPNYNGPRTSDKGEVISYCLRNDLYDFLVLRSKYLRKGTDRGKLKIQTFIVLLEELYSDMGKMWEKEEVTILRRYYSRGMEELESRLIGRSPESIIKKMQSIGLGWRINQL